MARQIGVTGVPFVVVDMKYAVSGAQPPELFREVVEEFKASARLYHFMPTLTEHDAERRLREMEHDTELAAA